jgi:hypothetical protein
MLNSINWSQFLNPLYWFEGVISTPGSALVTPVLDSSSQFFWFFLTLFTVFINLSIMVKIVRLFLNENHPLKNIIPIYTDNFIWMGILGYMWFISRQLSLALMGARFWLLIGLVWFLVVIFFLLRYLIKFFPLEIKYYNSQKK